MNNPYRNLVLVAESAHLAAAQMKYRYLLADTIAECKHEHVGEAPYKHNEWMPSDPDFRVCLQCGLREEGWGCGYKILRASLVTKWSREDLFNESRGITIDDDDKSLLVRREVTMLELVRNKLGIGGAA
jgi:hypothetical protein